MKLGLTADEVLTTTRSVRKRLDLERPVERDVLVECVEIAHQAPTGSNSQGWRWLFVEDQEKKTALAEMYRSNFYPYINDPNRPKTATIRVSESSIRPSIWPTSSIEFRFS